MIIDANLRQVILWQYETATQLIGVVDLMQAGYDRLELDFWENWYWDVFNIDTANDFGLGLWSKILGVKVSVDFEAQADKEAWGVGPNRRNFSPQTNFGSRDGGTVSLTTEQKRMVIRARYFQLTNRPTLDNINEFLKRYFWRGDSRVWVHDPQDMGLILYTFQYQPDGNLSFLLENMDILPRPACVGTGVRIISKTAWGVGPNRQNFSPPANFGHIGVT